MNRQGASKTGNNCLFRVWAPGKKSMMLHIVQPKDELIEMQQEANGYFSVTLPVTYSNCKYYYRPDGIHDYPDPASRYQPEGVDGPSQLVDQDFEWTDSNWRNRPLQEYIIYELHIGTFTAEGTFEAAIGRLDYLEALGINAIEIMPVSQFPGEYNWGYDGVFPYAAQNSYGGYAGLKKLVNACHEKGIAVILDVVYNHMGPEGNCMPAYGYYFTDKYKTPWGQAINFDGPYSDEVRDYFCCNALYWLEHFHIDALRLDAVHEMYDFGAVHFWEYLHDNVQLLGQRLGKNLYLIAESDLNNPKIIKHPEAGGYGFNAQWLDDFHHALYVLLYAEGLKRYGDFGRMEQLAKAYKDGYVHSGDYVRFRQRKYGRSTAGIPGDHFIAFIQNHDQVGNTVGGARLSDEVSLPQLKAAAAALLMSPYIPMLFMGEEYAEQAPFTYFIDHKSEELVDAVRKGRKKEFGHQNWETEPLDPKHRSTFEACKLKGADTGNNTQTELLNWYKQVIALRKSHDALRNFDKNSITVNVRAEGVFMLHRKSDDENAELLVIFHLSDEKTRLEPLTQYQGFSLLLGSGEEWPLELAANAININSWGVGIYTKLGSS